MSMRVVRRILNQKGTLSDGKSPEIFVEFSLTEYQNYIRGSIPSLKSGDGVIGFPDTAKAFYFFNQGEACTLRGGGIEAQILVTRLDRFEVTGPITKFPSDPQKP